MYLAQIISQHLDSQSQHLGYCFLVNCNTISCFHLAVIYGTSFSLTVFFLMGACLSTIDSNNNLTAVTKYISHVPWSIIQVPVELLKICILCLSESNRLGLELPNFLHTLFIDNSMITDFWFVSSTFLEHFRSIC